MSITPSGIAFNILNKALLNTIEQPFVVANVSIIDLKSFARSTSQWKYALLPSLYFFRTALYHKIGIPLSAHSMSPDAILILSSSQISS